LVLGLWFGGHPSIEVFFKPLIEELNALNNKTLVIQYGDEILNVKVVVLLCTADTLGKDLLQKKKQFNGYGACSYCFHPGWSVRQPNAKAQVRYKHIEGLEKRQHSTSVSFMRQAQITNEIVNGFKGISPLIGIPHFNIIDSCPIDYMHSNLLGNVRQLVSLWFDSKNHGRDFYIGLSIKRVDQKLLNIKPTSNISRKPRPLSDWSYWKANEWRNWLLYYAIPCLHRILPARYLKHFALLSQSIYILLKVEITANEMTAVDADLSLFVEQFEEYYGVNNMYYNIHLISHLVECVRNCGPLWAHSNFEFEDNNGVLVDYVKGTTHVLDQVASKYTFKRFIENDTREKSEILNVFLKKIDPKRSFSTLEKHDTVSLIGKPKLYRLNSAESLVFNKFNYNHEIVLSYSKFIFKKIIFSSNLYKRAKKSNDTIVELQDGSFGSVKYIFKSDDNNNFMILVEITHEISVSEMLVENICSHLKVLRRIETI
jgi:hypothetical protein